MRLCIASSTASCAQRLTLSSELPVASQYWCGLTGFTQTSQHPLGVVVARHALRLAFDAGDDFQQLRPVVRQACLHRLDLLDLASERGQQLVVRPALLYRIRQQATDLLQGKAGLLGSGDDAEGLQRLLRVNPITV